MSLQGMNGLDLLALIAGIIFAGCVIYWYCHKGIENKKPYDDDEPGMFV